MGAIAETINAAPPREDFWHRYFAPPEPGYASRVWHTSPAIDIAAYHFSWVWVLLPAFFIQSDDLVFYIYALMMGATLAHRHYGLPYAYLDENVFERFRRQLTWFPLICVVLFTLTPILVRREAQGSLASRAVAAIVFTSVLWNIWHTYMQKFGIMRLYLAKKEKNIPKTPGWVDKYLLLCWIPLYLSYLVPKNRYEILDYGSDVRAPLVAIIEFMHRHQASLLLPSIVIAAGGVALWLWHEWRTQRFGNRARLSAAAGTTLISTALFWTDPMNAVVAFAFSHAVEYMAFVWAFQRRFYYAPRYKPPLMQRLLRRPRWWYLAFTAIFVTAGILQVLWGETIFTDADPIAFAGMTGAKWFFYYAVYESLVHFYMDGFLWKMRRPEVSNYV
jgi:hypothetical protein